MENDNISRNPYRAYMMKAKEGKSQDPFDDSWEVKTNDTSSDTHDSKDAPLSRDVSLDFDMTTIASLLDQPKKKSLMESIREYLEKRTDEILMSNAPESVRVARLLIMQSKIDVHVPKSPTLFFTIMKRQQKLRRWLIELLAFSVGADFDALNSALLKIPVHEGTNSILSEQERAELLELADLTREVLLKCQPRSTHDVNNYECVLINRAIIAPGREIDYNLGAFAIDMINSFYQHRCIPLKWPQTRLGTYSAAATSSILNHKLCERDLQDTVSAHAKLIDVVHPDENVRAILRAPLEKWAKSRTRPITITPLSHIDGYGPTTTKAHCLAKIVRVREIDYMNRDRSWPTMPHEYEEPGLKPGMAGYRR